MNYNLFSTNWVCITWNYNEAAKNEPRALLNRTLFAIFNDKEKALKKLYWRCDLSLEESEFNNEGREMHLNDVKTYKIIVLSEIQL